jgi:hypothetical protein
MTTTIEQARNAKEKFKKEYPSQIVGITTDFDGSYMLVVQVYSEPAPGTLPASVDGVKVSIQQVDMPTPQTTTTTATPWFADKQTYLTALDKYGVQPARKAYEKLSTLFKR